MIEPGRGRIRSQISSRAVDKQYLVSLIVRSRLLAVILRPAAFVATASWPAFSWPHQNLHVARGPFDADIADQASYRAQNAADVTPGSADLST